MLLSLNDVKIKANIVLDKDDFAKGVDLTKKKKDYAISELNKKFHVNSNDHLQYAHDHILDYIHFVSDNISNDRGDFRTLK